MILSLYFNLKQTKVVTSILHTKSEKYIRLFNIVGNVAEMVYEKRISREGSWKSSGDDVQINSIEFYSKPTNDFGLRIFMLVIEK